MIDVYSENQKKLAHTIC